jgi:hypothetical protein
MGRVYRTLLLKHRVEELPSETVEKIAQLLKVQQEFRRWAEEWARSGGKAPMPEQRPLKYFAKEFIHAAGALEWLKEQRLSAASSRRLYSTPSSGWTTKKT